MMGTMEQDTELWDAAEFLDDDATQAAYLNLVLEENDPAEFAKALGTVARARGMARVASDAGLDRKSLYKSLGGVAKPEFDTVLRVLGALGIGIKLVTKPIDRSL